MEPVELEFEKDGVIGDGKGVIRDFSVEIKSGSDNVYLTFKNEEGAWVDQVSLDEARENIEENGGELKVGREYKDVEFNGPSEYEFVLDKHDVEQIMEAAKPFEAELEASREQEDELER